MRHISFQEEIYFQEKLFRKMINIKESERNDFQSKVCLKNDLNEPKIYLCSKLPSDRYNRARYN